VNRRFGPPLRSNTLGELIQLRRDGSVADYQTKFLSLLAHYKDLTEKHQINIFTAGLRNPLKTDVKLENSVTLEDAMALARTYEQRLYLQDDAPANASPPGRAIPTRVVSSTKFLLLPMPPSTTGSKEVSAPPTAPRLKRLTATEMAAKREHVECYHCSEKFSHEHLKVCPMKGIYLLQMHDDDTTVEDEEDDPHISLHAITGVSPAETMQLQVRIEESLLGALIDSGSTHSFIFVSAACRVHLQPLPRAALHVTVANGDQVASTGVCQAVHIFIDQEFVIDVFMIPLEGYDMVLGVHWLQSLGPIWWDFGRTRLCYWRDDHCIVWQGVTTLRSTT
jgi:hypothetical protein